MKKRKPLYPKAVILSVVLILVCGLANAQCNPTIGNYSSCPTKFLSITSDKCSIAPSVPEDFTITLTVNQSGASYTASPGSNTYIVSSSTSGTTVTYVLRKYINYASSVSLVVHMTGSCNQQNFAAIGIN